MANYSDPSGTLGIVIMIRVMLCYEFFFAGLLFQPVIAGLPGGPQTKKIATTNKHKIFQNNDTIQKQNKYNYDPNNTL